MGNASKVVVAFIVNVISDILEINASVSYIYIVYHIACNIQIAWYQALFARLILARMVVHVKLFLMAFFIVLAHLIIKDSVANFVCILYGKCRQIWIVSFWSSLNLGKVCEPNPCLNGGTCSPYGLDTYSCNCPFGFTGRNCETRKWNRVFIFIDDLYFSLGDPCVPNPCQNGGRCRPNAAAGTYVCDCPPSFVGQLCETSKLLLACKMHDIHKLDLHMHVCCFFL
jgi:hypothetical protein